MLLPIIIITIIFVIIIDFLYYYHYYYLLLSLSLLLSLLLLLTLVTIFIIIIFIIVIITEKVSTSEYLFNYVLFLFFEGTTTEIKVTAHLCYPCHHTCLFFSLINYSLFIYLGVICSSYILKIVLYMYYFL